MAKVPLDSTQAEHLSKLVIALRWELEETLDKRVSRLIPEGIYLSTKPINKFETVQALEQLLWLAKHHSQPSYLAILELDNFKHIRHQYDDVARGIVLQQLWQFLRQMFRSTDVVVHRDGAKVIGLYGMTGESGMKRLTEVLEVLHRQEFTGPNDTQFRATFRASAAEYPKDSTDL